MVKKSHMADSIQDFIKKWEAPHSLLSDNVKTEMSHTVQQILRNYTSRI